MDGAAFYWTNTEKIIMPISNNNLLIRQIRWLSTVILIVGMVGLVNRHIKIIALSISNRINLQNTNYLLQDVHLYSEGLCWPYQYHLQTFWWMYKSSSNKSLS
jgi:hypothetical protein